MPRATYRLQLNSSFTFAQAREQLGYISDLGVSHLYLSPITQAVSGSEHCYDVVDPTRVSTDLGGEEEFRQLSLAARQHGMGILVDIVPNHMCLNIAENLWWRDVLQNGQSSHYASFFDIDWERKILVPILREPIDRVLAKGDLALAFQNGATVLTYFEHVLPLSPESLAGADPSKLNDILAQQHYKLAYWRVAPKEINYRRFADVNSLIGFRVEQQHVFDEIHALIARLYRENLIEGIRIDHIDGLRDPAEYLHRLRALLGDDAWIVVEKNHRATNGWER